MTSRESAVKLTQAVRRGWYQSAMSLITRSQLARLTDDEVRSAVVELAARERLATAELIV